MQNKTKNKFKITFLLLAISVAVSVLQMRKVLAEQSISELDQNTSTTDSKTQDKIEELEKKAAVYREIIDIKRKQSASLSNQLDLMNSDIKQVEVEMEVNKRKLEDLNSQVARLQQQIDEKTKQINDQKITLSALIQAYYEYSQQNTFNIMFSRESIADIMMRRDKFSQTGEKINDLLDSIRSEKQALQNKINDLEKNKANVVEVSYTLESQSSDLEVAKKSKQTLLDQTQGEELRYQQLLSRIEEQKRELLDLDQLYSGGNISIGGLSVDEFIKKNQPPSSLKASESWFYYQQDPRWANVLIGNSDATLKKYGCAVSSVAMVLTQHGVGITPSKLAKQPIYTKEGLIAWPQDWSQPSLTLSSSGKNHYNINWATVDAQLAKNHPVIVNIKTSQGGQHYVVIHHKDPSRKGEYVVHDPYFGPNLYLSTSRALVGAAMGSNSSTTIDQMIIYN